MLQLQNLDKVIIGIWLASYFCRLFARKGSSETFAKVSNWIMKGCYVAIVVLFIIRVVQARG